MRNTSQNENNNRDQPAVDHRSSRSWRNIWVWIERALLIAGIAFLGGYGAARLDGFLQSRRALVQFAHVVPATKEVIANANTDATATEDISSRGNETHSTPLRNNDLKSNGAALAVLRIPQIQLVVPVLDGADRLTLNHAVGRIAGTAWPGESGNIGIAGHRDSFFRGLEKVKVGEPIELQTLKGTDTYVIDQIKIVTPESVDVLQAGSKPSLTLVTCYPFHFVGSSPKRFIVRASLTGHTEDAQPDRAAHSTFTTN
jgi:sortase A